MLFLLPLALTAQTDLFDWKTVHEIRIQFKEPNWDKILDSLKQQRGDGRLVAEVTIDGVSFSQVGVRYKGNSSYFNVRNSNSTKLPFNLKSDYVVKKQFFQGKIETLKLSNAFRDPTFIREALSYEVARKYMPAPRSSFARVFVNDTFLGLYNITESVDEQFLDQHFGNKKGHFIKCDPEWEETGAFENCPEGEKSSLYYLGDDMSCYAGSYEMKSDSSWPAFLHLIRVVNQAPDSLETVLDMDRVLWMHAFNMVLVNLDSYTGRLSHNYYLYQLPGGQFTPILWDMNLSFGGFRYTGIGKALTDLEMMELSPFIHYKEQNPKRPLITHAFQNTLYRKVYIGHMRTILEENFSNGWYLERAREIMAVLEKDVQADSNKLYTYEAFQQNISQAALAGKTSVVGIEQLMTGRVKYLQSHPLFNGKWPVFDKSEHIQFDNTLAFQATVKDAEQVYLVYRLTDKDPFTTVKMRDDGGHNDQMDADGVWGTTLPFQQGIQYYFIAEGDRAAVTLPRRASYELFNVR